MELQIISVNGYGNHKEEHLLIKAVKDCNLAGYVLADNTYDKAGKRSNKVRHTYWFPDAKIKAGELISVRTGKGTDILTKNDKGTPVHRFYWNLDESVWNDEGDCAVLLKVTDWSKKRADPAPKK